MKICLIAGNNADYIFSLVQQLNQLDVRVELLGSAEYDNPEYSALVTFILVRGVRDKQATVWEKAWGILRYYYGCLAHIRKSDVRVVHIQFFRFPFLEGLLLLFLYKLFGKKVVYTAHNVQSKGKDSNLNRFIFKLIYMNLSHIICHTDDIKSKLVTRYGLSPEKVTVVQRGVNQLTPLSNISKAAARQHLGLDQDAKVLLLFGRIRTEKGHFVALEALEHLPPSLHPISLLIAGEAVKPSHHAYLKELKQHVAERNLEDSVQFCNYFIPEEEIEMFFEASDVAVQPYLQGDFQSGVLFMTYRFGLPVIASNVGSLPEGITQGKWGYDFEVGNAKALAERICQFYDELYPQPNLRQSIRQHADKAFSWSRTAAETIDVYHRVLQ